MKISVISPLPGEEDEIIFRCHTLPDNMECFIYGLRYCELKFAGHDEYGISMITASDIYYFESVDKKVFAYCSQSVYEVKEKLYQVEELSEMLPFMRISKSMIINLDKIRHISLMFGGRFEALLENDEKVIISRQYVPILKDKLGACFHWSVSLI